MTFHRQLPILALVSFSCASSPSVRNVRGVAFHLTAAESPDADRFEERAASAGNQCAYWSNTAQVHEYESQAWPNLVHWLNAKTDEACVTMPPSAPPPPQPPAPQQVALNTTNTNEGTTDAPPLRNSPYARALAPLLDTEHNWLSFERLQEASKQCDSICSDCHDAYECRDESNCRRQCATEMYRIAQPHAGFSACEAPTTANSCDGVKQLLALYSWVGSCDRRCGGGCASKGDWRSALRTTPGVAGPHYTCDVKDPVVVEATRTAEASLLRILDLEIVPLIQTCSAAQSADACDPLLSWVGDATSCNPGNGKACAFDWQTALWTRVHEAWKGAAPQLEKLDWALLQQARAHCASPKTSDACDPLQEYLRIFPNGAHAVEAGALLARSKPRREALYQEELYARCMQNCLAEYVNATREHCDAKCR